MNNPVPARRERPRLQVVSGEAAILDGQWASDHWDASLLGIPARRGRGTARFAGISQPWLRDPVKRWSRLRLATGCAFATIDSGALALTRFSRFLAARHPQAGDARAITRPVLEDYLSWLLTQGYSASTRALSLSMIRVFFDACHRHGWLPGLAANATIYVEELPFHHDQIARFIPEFVMAQLESGQALSKIPHTTTRHLVVVMIETGLRGGDACNLPFNPVLTDSSGWPCLRFEAVKVRAEQLIPLSAKAAAAIRAQQDYVRQRWPAGSPWLFPGIDRQRRRLQAVLAQRLHPAAQALAARHRPARRGRAAGHRDRSPVPSHARDTADQLRRPAARGAKAPRACQPPHDQPLRQGPRRHHPGGVRPLPVPAGEHLRRSRSATTPTPRPLRPSGSSTTSTGSATACPNGYCAARPSRTARTPTPA